MHVDDIRILRRFESSTGTTNKAKKVATSKKLYAVERVVGERTAQTGQKQYLIKWVGYKEHTWLATVNISPKVGSCDPSLLDWTSRQDTATDSDGAVVAQLRNGSIRRIGGC